MHRITSLNHQKYLQVLNTGLFQASLAKLRKAAIGFVMSVELSVTLFSWNLSVPARRNFVKFYLRGGYYNVAIQSNFGLKSEKII